MSAELQQSYDTFPYQSFSFPQSHPDRLATIGELFGMTPVPIARSRVLELGCASGGNLIPIAATLPEAEFVGVDLSPVQVRQGMADIDALGLTNIRMLATDIMDFGEEFGSFDYIIAHGVYSWVPNEVQERMLAICARQLSPSGIAYISYNTLPGWRMRAVVRDAMTYHTRRLVDPVQRVAQSRAMLEFLAESLKGDASPYGSVLKKEAEQLRTKDDYYILHDHLEAVNEPLYFHQFMERAGRHGLNYLGEADFVTMLGTEFAPPVTQTLASVAPDVQSREQYMDFLRARTFRQTLLVHKDVALTRKLSPLRVMALRVASFAKPVGSPDLRADTAEIFGTPEKREIRVAARLPKAALLELAEKMAACHSLRRAPCERAHAAWRARRVARRRAKAAGIRHSPMLCRGSRRAAPRAIAVRHRPGRAARGQRRRALARGPRRARHEPAARAWID